MPSPNGQFLSIMPLFKTGKHTSLSAFFSRWSSSADATVADALEVVQNFDPVYILCTCLAFLAWRQLEEERGVGESSTDDSMYDPLMVIALCA